MLGLVKYGTASVFPRASSARSGDIYQRYATGRYRQAFLALGGDDMPHRLAEPVFRRCQQLAADPA